MQLKTKNKITHWIPVTEPSDWLFLEVTLVMRGGTFDLVIFLWGLFPIPFPLTPKYLIPLECFPIPFPLPICFVLVEHCIQPSFFFLEDFRTDIRCFNLPCMTKQEASHPIPSQPLSMSNFLPFLLIIMTHKSS